MGATPPRRLTAPPPASSVVPVLTSTGTPCVLACRSRRRVVCRLTVRDRPLAGEALGDLRPVHHVPPGVDVVRAPVLVLEVVGMLPDVDSEERGLAVRDRVVLVRGRDHREVAPVLDEPGPARAEPVDARVLELLLETRERSERRLDRRSELAVGLASTFRAHPLPEERVVVVAAAVVTHRGRFGAKLVEVLQDPLARLVLPVGARRRSAYPVRLPPA